ncbi:MAG: DUF58 domain-containing protein [Deltaproteobacteria bacterium]|nr:DUF58 domain-containing protein [Deltaproteobacteria bacterium]
MSPADQGEAASAAPTSLRGVTTPEASASSTAKGAPPARRDETRGRKRWARRLKFTREGKYFLGITLGVGLAAINTGNNPLYLLLGMMLSLIIVSGVMSELSLRTLSVRRRLPKRAQVGRAHLVEIEVWNDKEQVPSYAIEVEDLRAGQPADKRCFFLKVSPRSTQVAAYRRTPQRRGIERHSGFRVATRFPFGLFEKSRELDVVEELIVYPAVDAIRLPRRGRGDATGDVGPVGRGLGEETYAIRPMRDGDDPRDIYWRKSTLPGQLVMRERAHEMRHDVNLRLDDHRPLGPLPTSRTDEDFERRIREVASLAVAHVQRGDRVTIATTSGRRIVSDKARGLDPLLRFLALLEQVDRPPPTIDVGGNLTIVKESAA